MPYYSYACCGDRHSSKKTQKGVLNLFRLLPCQGFSSNHPFFLPRLVAKGLQGALVEKLLASELSSCPC